MKDISIGIVGASGLVGQIIFDLLFNDKYYNLKICGSDKLALNNEFIMKYYYSTDEDDKVYHFKYIKLDETFFDDLKVVFFCATNDITEYWWKYALEKNIHIIDSSSFLRMKPEIPLIVPEINGYLIKDSQIYASPNCSTTLLCMVIFPLLKLSNIKRLDVSTYQAVSGAGKKAIDELKKEMIDYTKEKSIVKKSDDVFKSQIVNNCFSHDSSIDLETGYNGEELKIINETKKILNNFDMKISATCVRIPVIRSHCLSVKIKFIKPVLIDDIFTVLSEMSGVTIIDDRTLNKFPEPIDASEKSNVLVGRIRKDYDDDTNRIYHLFICGDQLLKGAAYNAYQIFTELLNIKFDTC